MELAVILPLVLALGAAPALLLAGSLHRRLATPLAFIMAGSTFAALLWGWLAGGGSVTIPWAPTLGLELAFTLDGLAALYGLLATGVGLVVLAYSLGYMPRHLQHAGRPPQEQLRFQFFMLLFMGSMVALVMAQDLILLFVFWDLTAIASYFLISFDRQSLQARASALMALFVTGVTAILLLISAQLLHAEHHTFSLVRLGTEVQAGPLLTVSGLLITVAALAKSAQFPLHFWLPRAMAAPTPVSAYLHSAAMVAAGVFLLGRTYPLLQRSGAVLGVLLTAGLLSVLYGGLVALTRDGLKQVLAGSTIAQYGYVLLLLGLGGPQAAASAAFYVLAHGLAKSALFLTAGTVTEATGARNLSETGGLVRAMPLLAAASGVAAATLASVPFTIGFFKDEFLFGLALEQGAVFAAIAILAAGSTLAYSWRFWSGIFLGKPKQKPASLPVTLVAPIAVLALVALYGGIDASPFALLAASAAGPAAAGSAQLDAHYHAEIRPEYLMAGAAFAFGMLLSVFRHRWLPLAQWLLRVDLRFGAEQAYARMIRRLHAASDGLHQLEVGRLRTGIGSVLVPTGLLMVVAVFLSGAAAPFRAGAVTVNDIPLITAFLVTAVSSVALTVTRGHLALAAVLSGTGFSLAVIYAFHGAANVALVAVLIETMLTLLFVGTLALFPRQVLERQNLLPLASPRRLGWIAVLVSVVTLPTVWGAISYQPAGLLAARRYLELAPLAHARNVVSAILADFRGMDTMGEVTVLALVLLGVGALASEIGPGKAGSSGLAARPVPAARLVTQGIARILYLPGFMVAAALLVKGYADTGDGFSAGIVAALSVLLRYLAFGHEAAMQMPLVRHARSVSFAGLLLALSVAFTPLLRGDAFLTHLPPPGVTPVHIGSLELITALLFDAGVFLLVLGFAVGVMKNLARIANPSAEPQEQP